MVFIMSMLLVVDVPSGISYVTNILPLSSVGIKPVGLFLKRKNKPTNKHASNTNTIGVAFIDLATPLVYDLDNLPKPLLNLAKTLSSTFLFALGSFAGCSNNVHNAGVNDNATNAEIRTAIPMVTANC